MTLHSTDTVQGATTHTWIFPATLCQQKQILHKRGQLLGRWKTRCPEGLPPWQETAWTLGEEQPPFMRSLCSRKGQTKGSGDSEAIGIPPVMVNKDTEEPVYSFLTSYRQQRQQATDFPFSLTEGTPILFGCATHTPNMPRGRWILPQPKG